MSEAGKEEEAYVSCSIKVTAVGRDILRGLWLVSQSSLSNEQEAGASIHRV